MPQHDAPLTAFILWMLKADAERLARDPAVIAKHFGIPNVDHVRGYLRINGGREA